MYEQKRIVLYDNNDVNLLFTERESLFLDLSGRR